MRTHLDRSHHRGLRASPALLVALVGLLAALRARRHQHAGRCAQSRKWVAEVKAARRRRWIRCR